MLVLAPELYLPLRNLAAQWHASADGLAVAGRLLDLVEAPAVATAGLDEPPSVRETAVRLEDVSFAYPARPGAVLAGVTLELPPVRRSRSSARAAAARAPLPLSSCASSSPAGRLTVGTTDLATCDLAAWRRSLPGFLSARRCSTARSPRTSAWEPEDAAEADVREAGVLAGADAFVSELPDGYETSETERARCQRGSGSASRSLALSFVTRRS